MTEPTASPDATELRQRLETNHDHIWLSPRCDDERTWCQDDIGPCDDCGEPTIKYVRADIAEADLVALRQEVERLTRDLHSMTDLEELQAKSLDETDAELQAAKASLRLATQRREDVVEALKPFAAFGAAVYGPLYGDNEPVFGPVGTEEHTLKVRDFRRAALALHNPRRIRTYDRHVDARRDSSGPR